MAYEHKTTEATDVPEVRWFTVKPPAESEHLQIPTWDFGIAEGLEKRSYDFHRGDRRFVQHISEHDVGVAVVVYTNRKVLEDGKPRLVAKAEIDYTVIWTVLEP